MKRDETREKTAKETRTKGSLLHIEDEAQGQVVEE